MDDVAFASFRELVPAGPLGVVQVQVFKFRILQNLPLADFYSVFFNFTHELLHDVFGTQGVVLRTKCPYFLVEVLDLTSELLVVGVEPSHTAHLPHQFRFEAFDLLFEKANLVFVNDYVSGVLDHACLQ